MEFKVGDRVTWAAYRWYGEGTVVQPNCLEEGQVAVRFDRYYDYEDEMYKHLDHHTPYAKDLTLVSRGQEIVDRLLSDFAEYPAVSYYQFPGGIEVRQISAHLTSFGGQALQYIARSCRLDGNNKGEQVSDLKKVIDFCNWEIERLEEQK